ncbi:ATP-binding protein [Paracidovorax sp. MALMAid1276]|uniref:hybrid sensor histidine kinase/response regulator n=1 Tax=Paracidovorax sp. MALMAid1276 TaxID=3411631 RepID=UPI003B98E970
MTASPAAADGVPGLPSLSGRLLLLEASFARLRLSMCAMPAMGLLFGLLLNWQGGQGTGLFWWGAAYVPVLLGVWWAHRHYRRSRGVEPPQALLPRWHRRVCGLALVHGIGMSLSVAVCLGHAGYEFLLLLYITLAGILAANAAQMSATLPAYRMLLAGATCGLVMLPWAFPAYWPFVLPMTLVMTLVIDRSAVTANGFFVRQVLLEERSRDLAERYREASAAAQAALDEKNRFLSTAAHDLRQPVHAMALLAEAIVLESRGHPRIPPLVEQWQLSMRSLSHLFNALLDLSRIESGTLDQRPAAVRLASLFDDLHHQFAHDAAARGLALRLRPPSLQAQVLADPALLRQAVANLVHNALRYTPAGGVLVAVRRRGSHWRIEVWDTGEGVAPQEQEAIYRAFYRPQGTGRVQHDGHGLGLAVVARCVALMGARQGMASRPGQGSCFWIELQALPPAMLGTPGAPESGAEAPPSVTSPLRGRCLVLDDDPYVLRGWSALLRGWGMDVRTARTPAQAHDFLDAGFVPQAILCDQRLSSGDSGYEVLQALLARCPAARGAMVSGEFDAPALQEAEEEGYLVLRKPVDPTELHAVLAQWTASENLY